MEPLDKMCNISRYNFCKLEGIHFDITSTIISDSQRDIISLIGNVFLSSGFSTFGIVANIINLIIFHRQGLDTTINISFFSLGISDLLGLIFQQISNIFVSPWFVKLDLPMSYSGMQFMTARIPRGLFTRVTFFITVYITAERCLCVAFPLHIKQWITPRRTVIILISIYTLTLGTAISLYSTSFIAWKFYPERNRSLLSLGFRNFKTTAFAMSYFVLATSGVVAFLSVVILTLVLVHKLGQKNNWRKTAVVQHGKFDCMSQRDRATVKMVVIIAGLLIICYIPSVFLCLVIFLVPEFTEIGRYRNIYSILWSVAMVLENINSSVNICFYYKMSSKYRRTFRELFSIRSHIQDAKEGVHH